MFILFLVQSPNKQTLPQEKIRPLTSLDHTQSPFYDPEGGAITPVARVLVERIARKVGPVWIFRYFYFFPFSHFSSAVVRRKSTATLTL